MTHMSRTSVFFTQPMVSIITTSFVNEEKQLANSGTDTYYFYLLLCMGA